MGEPWIEGRECGSCGWFERNSECPCGECGWCHKSPGDPDFHKVPAYWGCGEWTTPDTVKIWMNSRVPVYYRENNDVLSKYVSTVVEKYTTNSKLDELGLGQLGKTPSDDKDE